MASPDATPYVDLVLNDLDPQDVIDMALDNLKTALPAWQPREGNTEMLLLEAMGVQVAELIYAINQLPSSVVQVLLKLNGIEYDPGAQPTVNLQFNLTEAGGAIPLGTSVRMEVETQPDNPMIFTTTSDVTADPGSTTVIAPALGSLYTSAANDYPAGTVCTLIDSLVNVETVSTASTVTGGRDEESDTDYFERGTQLFGRMTSTLVIASQFKTVMLEEVYVKRAYVIDNYDAPSDTAHDGPTGTDEGHITVVAYGDGRQLTSGEKTALLDKVTSLASANLAVHMIDPVLVPVDVNVTVKLADGFIPSDVVTNVQTNLRAYFNTSSWDWSQEVRRNNIIGIVSQTPGVAYVETLTTPGADYSVAPVAPLLVEGTFSVTVTV